MRFVHPKDLKIGDIVRYVSRKSWISPNYHDTDNYGTINQLYKVHKILKTTARHHMCGEDGLNNPLLASVSDDFRDFSAWYGSFVIVNREIKKTIKEYGIVKFCRRYYK